MSTFVLTEAGLWVGGVAVSDIGNSLTVDTSRDVHDATTFAVGRTARSNKVGLFNASVQASGFADMTDYDKDLFALLENGTQTVVSAAADQSDGEIAYTFRSITAALTPLSGTVGDMAAFSVNAAGRGGVRPIRGTILHPETARTASSVGVGRELGAVSATQSVYGALHVVNASAADTLDVIVQSDDNSGFASPTTRLTFAQATDIGAQWQAAAGPITDTWWRVSYTIAGTAPSFTFVVVVGIA